jgi:hypothetical protein
MDEGALGMGHLSLKRHCGEGLGGAPSLGTLENVLRKSPDTGISLHSGPFTSEGNLVWWGRAVRLPMTLYDE